MFSTVLWGSGWASHTLQGDPGTHWQDRRGTPDTISCNMCGGKVWVILDVFENVQGS